MESTRITLKRPDKIVAGVIAALVIGGIGYGLFIAVDSTQDRLNAKERRP